MRLERVGLSLLEPAVARTTVVIHGALPPGLIVAIAFLAVKLPGAGNRSFSVAASQGLAAKRGAYYDAAKELCGPVNVRA